MARLVSEVDGFRASIEELRAAGRVEAMEDLMSGLLGELVRSHSHKLLVLLMMGSKWLHARGVVHVQPCGDIV